jgi:hypothetical protein
MTVYVVYGNAEGRVHPIECCGIYKDEEKAKEKAKEVYGGYVSEWEVIE